MALFHEILRYFTLIDLGLYGEIEAQRLIQILGEIGDIGGIVDEIMPVNPRLSCADNYACTSTSSYRKAITINVEHTVSDDVGEVPCEVL